MKLIDIFTSSFCAMLFFFLLSGFCLIHASEENEETRPNTHLPEENTDLFEGDIKMDEELKEWLFGSPDKQREAVMGMNRHWPGGIVPYEIDSALDFTTRKNRIYEAIEHYNNNTCIRFIPHTTEDYYVKFVEDSGCYSYVGRVLFTKGYQEISLGVGCHVLGTVIHEMMHALGFFHEHTRIDRDDYVTVVWSNIMSVAASNFKKYLHGEADVVGVEYDYGSLMHYGDTAFSIDGNKTIIPKNTSAVIGQRIGFSPSDIRQINTVYHCGKAGSGNCTDTRTRCYYYKQMGYCSSHPAVKQNCPLTCGECKNTPACSDTLQRSCAYFKNLGYCDASSTHNPKMVKACSKTCAICS